MCELTVVKVEQIFELFSIRNFTNELKKIKTWLVFHDLFKIRGKKLKKFICFC